MVGICGVLGGKEEGVRRFLESQPRTGRERTSTFTDDRLAVRVDGHAPAVAHQPATASDGDVLVWVWGDLFGHTCTETGVYVPREDPTGSDAAYVAERYDVAGREVADTLNGQFVGVVYDRSREQVTLFNDRLGSRPVFHTRTARGAFAFTTSIQGFASHPDIPIAFDQPYLYEYLALKKVFGTRTPIAGVEKLPPATLAAVDLPDFQAGRDSDGERGAAESDGAGPLRTECYWRPSYQPTNRRFSDLVDRFADLIVTVVEERVSDDRRYGLMLSGGADSRLVLAAFAAVDQPVTVLHMNDWHNREARIAERCADAAGAEFRFLQRGDDYQANALERNPQFANFASSFNQAHASGFADVIADEVDVLVSGHYPNEMVGDFADLPTPVLDTPLGYIEIPVRKRLEGPSDYVAFLDADLPSYLETPPTLADILSDEIYEVDDGIVHHGVGYGSMQDLAVFSEIYPLTNDTEHLNYVDLLRIAPYWTPFLDDRVVEFAEALPMAYRTRRDLVKQTLRRLDPELAALPDGNTGVPVKYPYPVHYLADKAVRFRAKFLPRRTPKPHYSHDSWPDNDELLREQEFVRETIDRNEELIRRLPFVDWDGVDECYRSQLAGAYRRPELFTLVSILGMPLARSACAD
ncbi:asparagine synthase-related protein [Haloglomus litoreum]|uniref:asparagine synthase-related protein n=1 Tax=Haloglomus litoreum TaxID=3034026 RepID=UPI0023E7CFF3|nr:asparagine synthase-related protein [Haloglomus sp. DT116]